MGKFLALLLMGFGALPAAAEAPAADAPDGLLVLGVVGREDSGAAVHGERIVVADPRTGETHARVLPGGTLCHGPVMAVGDRVVFSGYDGRHAVARSLPLTLLGSASSLGEAETITPSATDGRLWLGRWRHGRGVARARLRELDLASGRVVSRTTEVLPRWSRLEAALSGGFVVGHGRWLTFWEHPLDRPLRSVRDAWLVAAGRSRYAWCGPRCGALRVWSHAGERFLRPPPGIRLRQGDGAFSPDGDRLAVPVTHRGDPRVAVIDLARGAWTVVPGGRLRGYGAIAWSPLGAWLYFTDAGEPLRAWAPGMAHAARVPVEPGGTVMSIATSG